MGIEQLYTAQINANSARGNTVRIDALTANNLKGVLAGGNFFDVFLAHLVEAREKTSDKPKEEKLLTSDAPVLKESAEFKESSAATTKYDPETVAVQNALASGEDEIIDVIVSDNSYDADVEENPDLAADALLDESIDISSETSPEDSVETEVNHALFLNARIFKHLLKSALQDISSGSEDTQIKNPVVARFFNYLDNHEDEKEAVFANAFSMLLDHIGEDMDLQDLDSPEMLVMNLTPQELTELKGHINDLINSYAQSEGTPNQQGIIASLKALLIGNGEEMLQTMDSRYLNGKSVNSKDFHDHLSDADKSNVDVLEELKTPAETKTKTSNVVPQKPQDIDYKPVSFDVVDVIENFDSLITTSQETSTTTSTPNASPHGLQSLTSNLIQVSHAGQLHPASHMVAMQIQKSAQDGQNKTFTVQLDPPDLGRIKIHMEFSHKDKTMKTVLTVEKPETFVMLQRDAQTLERSLQNMGLDLDSNIGFELSQNDSDFMGDNRRGGGHDHGGAHGAGDSHGQDYVEDTSLLWLIDPETGHTRYDLWA